MSDVIGSFAVKSIGDYAQEGTVTSKFSGLEYEREGRLAEDYFDSPRLLSPTHEQGFSFRIGLAGDRPSAYRMIDTLLFANPESINIDAIVGYVRKNDEKNFLVIHPGIASE